MLHKLPGCPEVTSAHRAEGPAKLLAHLVLFRLAMNDDITAEVSLTGVAPALRLTAAPPAGRVTHPKVFKLNNKSEPLICVCVFTCPAVCVC